MLCFVLGTVQETRATIPTTHVTREGGHEKLTPNGRIVKFASIGIILFTFHVNVMIIYTNSSKPYFESM